MSNRRGWITPAQERSTLKAPVKPIPSSSAKLDMATNAPTGARGQRTMADRFLSDAEREQHLKDTEADRMRRSFGVQNLGERK